MGPHHRIKQVFRGALESLTKHGNSVITISILEERKKEREGERREERGRGEEGTEREIEGYTCMFF